MRYLRLCLMELLQQGISKMDAVIKYAVVADNISKFNYYRPTAPF